MWHSINEYLEIKIVMKVSQDREERERVIIRFIIKETNSSTDSDQLTAQAEGVSRRQGPSSLAFF